MKSVHISLDSIEKVKTFVNTLTKFECEFDLISDRYRIDARSIMGIYSLDLSKPLQLDIHEEDTVVANVIEGLKDFIVQG